MNEKKSFERKYKFQELVKEGQLLIPCVWDCFSARAAELSGYKSALVSSAAVAYAMTGMADVGLMTADEMIEISARIAMASPLALMIDSEGGYGDTPLHAYRNMRRLALAGVGAIMMSDQCGNGGVERWLYKEKYLPETSSLLPREEWLAKVKASLEAVKGTDCMVIARTGAWYSAGLEEAIVRCQLAVEMGAHMTMVCGMTKPEECEAVAARVPGIKIYPDIISQNGVPDMEMSELERLGFQMVSVHFLEKGAFDGMLRYCERIQQDRNTVWVDQHDMGGRGVRDWMQQMALYVDYHDWMRFEEECYEKADALIPAAEGRGNR